jgi:hypothetical protein
MVAIEKADANLFSASLADYVKSTPFDNAMTALIVEVKNRNFHID